MTVCIKYLINVFRAHRGCPHSLINNPRSLAKVCGEPLYSKHTRFLRETPINSLLY